MHLSDGEHIRVIRRAANVRWQASAWLRTKFLRVHCFHPIAASRGSAPSSLERSLERRLVCLTYMHRNCPRAVMILLEVGRKFCA